MGKTKRRATKRGGTGKKNKAVRGMSAALPVTPSPATIVFSAKLALGTHAPRFLFFLLTSVFLGVRPLPSQAALFLLRLAKFIQQAVNINPNHLCNGTAPRRGKRVARAAAVAVRQSGASNDQDGKRRCMRALVRSQCTCGLRDPEACAVATGRIQSGGPALGRGGTGAEPGQGRGGLGRRGAERAPRRDVRAGGDQHNAHMTEAHTTATMKVTTAAAACTGLGGRGGGAGGGACDTRACMCMRVRVCVHVCVHVSMCVCVEGGDGGGWLCTAKRTNGRGSLRRPLGWLTSPLPP